MNSPSRQHDRRGAVLLEVLFALMIFAMMAGLFSGTFNQATRSLSRMQLQAQAADLMVTVSSEIQVGLIDLEDSGPNAFETPLDDWTWQVTLGHGENTDSFMPVQQVTVTINQPGNQYRLEQSFLLNDAAAGEQPPAPTFEDDSDYVAKTLE